MKLVTAETERLRIEIYATPVAKVTKGVSKNMSFSQFSTPLVQCLEQCTIG